MTEEVKPRQLRGIRMTKRRHVRRELVRVVRDLREGKLRPDVANAVVSALQAILSILPADEPRRTKAAKAEAAPPRALPVIPAVGSARLGIREVEARLGVDRCTLWRWYKAGKLPAPHFVGERRFWMLRDIEEWEAAETTRPPELRKSGRNLNGGRPEDKVNI